MISLPQTPYQAHQLQQQNHFYHNQIPHSNTHLAATTTSNLNRTDFIATPASLTSANLGALAQNGRHPVASMQSASWANLAHYNNPDNKLGRLPHQRESSLSSLGSTGPTSPFNPNTSNPHIAITDSAGDDLAEMHAHDAVNGQAGSYYQLSKVNGPYTGYHNLDQTLPEMAYPLAISGPPHAKPRLDRNNLLPAPDLSTGSLSRPASVASSIGGDSPATPTVGNDEPIEKRHKGRHPVNNGTTSHSSRFPRVDGYGNVPKLDRTMTDVYSDELYSPNFTITSTPPSQPQMQTVSPPSDIFSQRLNAANSQHLSVSHSPISSVPRGRSSPFRNGSPFASASHDFGASANGMPVNTAMRIREQNKASQDAQMLQQQMARARGNEPETPKTISPKDAVLEFNDTEAHNFPLFPSNDANLELEQLAKTMVPHGVNQAFMNGGQAADQFNYLAPHMASGLQLPQQYPFISRPGQPSNNSPPRLSSSGSNSDSAGSTPGLLSRPMGTGAEGGTYTCTYHGCTLRFETPALLQKHKREGHRQAHGLVGARAHDMGMTSSLLNSQAGPHRCDRINPSTGKPCSTVFSRPYDLTRHEDTIHNARKQKVRCDLCTEEKTFSRADALTRHYRVCHPDVDLPGKHRRRGGS
jgi:hypothetical protein